ncbi:MAG: hypothetical protein FWH26_04300 [Oscillospiraceae bacterium]|nr:hypothetical protein [Oscillospiraceae bacterium]
MKTTKRILAVLTALALSLGVFAVGANALQHGVYPEASDFDTVTDAMDFWQIIYLIFLKTTDDFPQDSEWDNAVHFKPGSTCLMMQEDLINLSRQYFPRICYTCMNEVRGQIQQGCACPGGTPQDGTTVNLLTAYNAHKTNNLIPWAQNIVSQANVIYARHLNAAGLAHLYSTMKPFQVSYANMACYRDWYEDYCDFFNDTSVMPHPIRSDDPTEPVFDPASGIFILDPSGQLAPNATISVTELTNSNPNSDDGYSGPGNVKQAWNIDLLVNGSIFNGSLSGYIELYLPVTNLILSPGPLPNNINVYHKGSKVLVPPPEVVLIGGQTYIKVQVNSFSPFELVEESTGGDDTGDTTPPALKWWQALPGLLQWILRWICFGWLWMK